MRPKRAPLLAAALALSACAPPPPRAPARPRDAGAAPAGDAGVAASPVLPSLDALAARGPAEAPLMREVARSSEALGETPARAGERDACFRANVAASGPVRIWFEDERRARRGEAAAGGMIPPRGPACARKGETLRLVVTPVAVASAAPIHARAVVWQSP